jgi:hypothetical protein
MGQHPAPHAGSPAEDQPTSSWLVGSRRRGDHVTVVRKPHSKGDPPMLSKKLTLGLTVAALTLAVGAGLGLGTATASTTTSPLAPTPTTTTVLSDTITFSGVATPTAVARSYTLTSNQCTLTSDGETNIFPCTITLNFSLATLLGTGHVASADGTVTWAFRLVPVAPAGTYMMIGNCSAANACIETETEHGVTVTYPATVSGTLTIAPIPGTPNLKVTGKISVFESPTAP